MGLPSFVFVALPHGTLTRLTPNEPCESIFVMLRLLRKSEVRPTMLPDAEPGFVFAMDRMRGSSLVRKKPFGGPLS